MEDKPFPPSQSHPLNMVSQLQTSLILITMTAWLTSLDGSKFKLTWSIPPDKAFYTNWSNHHFFQTGDILVFDFNSEFHNVMRVSRRDYDSCNTENPHQVFWVGPVNVPLIQGGVHYFICSMSNYCHLGQKVSVAVHRHSSSSPRRMQPIPQQPVTSLIPTPPPCKPVVHVSSTPPPSNVHSSVKSSSGFFGFVMWNWMMHTTVVVVVYMN